MPTTDSYFKSCLNRMIPQLVYPSSPCTSGNSSCRGVGCGCRLVVLLPPSGVVYAPHLLPFSEDRRASLRSLQNCSLTRWHLYVDVIHKACSVLVLTHLSHFLASHTCLTLAISSPLILLISISPDLAFLARVVPLCVAEGWREGWCGEHPCKLPLAGNL